MVKAVVGFPEEVHISRMVDERGVLLEASVRREDMGRVIGRLGTTIEAMRCVLRVAGLAHGSTVGFKLLEPECEDAI